jgi:hypothetical protein
MKVLIFNYKDKRRDKKSNRPVNFERFLFKAFLIVFVLLLGVQAALLNPAIKSSITKQESIEGAPLGVEEYLYNFGTIEMELLDEDSIPALKILVNGEEKACFDTKNIRLDVIEGDIIEIDGSAVNDNVKVAISSVSTNINKEYVGKIFQIDGNVQNIVKVKINTQ